MFLPELTAGQQQVLNTTTFKGYNHNPSIGDGEMYDMKNLSGRSYPLLDQRKPRGITDLDANGNVEQKLHGIAGRDDLILIRGSKVFYNMMEVFGISVSEDESMQPKKIVNMGAYVCIWPDKVFFNTVDTTDYGYMSAKTEVAGSSVTAIMCRGDGTEYDYSLIAQGTTAPTVPVNGDLWLDQSGSNDVLKQYDAGTSSWVEVASTFVKISGTGIGEKFRMYDAVNITGLEADTIDEKVQAQVQALNTSMIVYFAGTNYIIVAGLLSRAVNMTATTMIQVERPVPDLDYICESNNRLWGCKYGIENGQMVNEIRACKLGDFKNWNCFMGLATDSYTVSVGSDGPFTGAVSQRSYPIFFKENCIHRISGTTPSSFTLTTTVCRGIQEGSWRSAVVANEAVYYKSRSDIMMYDGSSVPTSISAALGETLYSDARAGAIDGKYYISMKDKLNTWHLFVYDTKTGNWYREDNFHAMGFGAVEDELYAIDEDNNTLVSMLGSLGETEGDLEWYAVFGLFGTDYTGQKYLSRFNIRMQIESTAKAKLEIQYDQDGDWVDQGEIKGRNTKSFLIPVIPRRCDHLQVRLSGKGRCRIYSISRVLEVGSDG